MRNWETARQNSHLHVDASVLVVFQFWHEPPLISKRHRGLDNHQASKVKQQDEIPRAEDWDNSYQEFP